MIKSQGHGLLDTPERSPRLGRVTSRTPSPFSTFPTTASVPVVVVADRRVSRPGSRGILEERIVSALSSSSTESASEAAQRLQRLPHYVTDVTDALPEEGGADATLAQTYQGSWQEEYAWKRGRLLHEEETRERPLKTSESLQVKKVPSDPPSLLMTKAVSDTTCMAASRQKEAARDPNHVSHQFFHVEPCLYTHRMFKMAAKIFHVLKDTDLDSEERRAFNRRQQQRRGVTSVQPPKAKIPDMDFINAQEQIRTFELTFATLKYQTVFHDILSKIGFFDDNRDLRSDYSLVCIILYDLQSRKFQRRVPKPGEDLDISCKLVEDALFSRRTKILSTIAKERIRHGAPSIEYLLPEQVRHKDETKSRIPVYTWVNQLKLTVPEFIDGIEREGFTCVADDVDMSDQTGHVFRVDRHCPDLIAFPPHVAMYFKDSHWVKYGGLVLQDKSSCLAPITVAKLLTSDHDVIHVNIGTGMTTAHIASLMESSRSHIWAFGADEPQKARKVQKNLDRLGVRNTKILHENFLNIDVEDQRFKNVRVIYISANCSKSAITSPVQFIVSEGEDMQILGELCKADIDMAHVGELMQSHDQQIRHALKFPRIQAVVYSTRSRYEAENESVVTRAVEFVNMTSGRKLPFKVSPPVIPFSSEEIGSGHSGVDGRYIRFRPTDKANGCFLAIVSREPEDPKDAARSVISRAKSKGMLGKLTSTEEVTEVKKAIRRHPSRKAASAPELKPDEKVASPSPRVSATSPRTTRRTPSPVKVKIASSLPMMRLNHKLRMNHKPPAAHGARQYQEKLIARMKKSLRDSTAHRVRMDGHSNNAIDVHGSDPVDVDT